ncbi:tetratricopeptide repeat protein [Amycolatopsis sp. NBC_00348]|uniref:tetratricopeptide repeat protein n=1 Tax=Amycolatopsis sp. NBC_00348 TaxID=2975956 RepID=UPI003FA45EA3
MTEAGQHAAALPLWRELLEESITINGRLHLETLGYRTEAADCLGRRGDPTEAVRLLTDATRLEDPPSTNVLGIGRGLSNERCNSG